jgi:hypothetical protein
VKNSSGQDIDLAANVICKDGQTTGDETLEHKGGVFYLEVMADGPWTIDIQTVN